MSVPVFPALLVNEIPVAAVYKQYLRRGKERRFTIAYYLVCYFAIAILPTAYNYLSDSALKSPLSLVFSGWPVIVIGAYLGAAEKHGIV